MSKNVPEVTSRTRTPERPILPAAIRENGLRQGHVTFVQPGGNDRQYAFSEFSAKVDHRANQLRKAGLNRGDRVGFVLTENEDFVISFLGAMAVGVVPVPMYPPMSLGRLDGYVETASRILTAARACALLTDRKARNVLWSLLNRVESLDSLICVEDLTESKSTLPPDLGEIRLDDLAFIQFTSGSTSTPKGVVVTHRCLLANISGIMNAGLEVNADTDVTISWLPLYHDMGLIGFMMCPLWYSLSAVFIPTLSFIKQPSLWMQTVSRYKGTITFAPNFAYALAVRRTSEAKLETLDVSTLKAVGCGAEPNHPGTLKAFVDHFSKAGLKPGAMLPCYGMAEATLAMTFSPLHRGIRIDEIDAETYHSKGKAEPSNGGTTLELVSCGIPFPHHAVAIVDDQDNELPERHTGEVVFRGASIAAGYFEQPDASELSFRKSGLHTGDYGYIADGELYVTGRKKDLIILNGRNYDPQSIEWEAAEVPGVRKGNVVAFSRPGRQSEELIVLAETKTKDNAEQLTDAIRTQVNEALFLNIADVVLLSPGQLPKTSSGKLQRSRAREQYLDGTLGAQGVRTQGTRGKAFMLAKHLSLSMVARLRHNVKRRISGVKP